MKRIIRLTESDLTRIVRRVIAESQHTEYEELDEGWFGPSDEEIEERRVELIRKIDDLLEDEGLTDDDLKNSVMSVLKQAESNDYDGDVEISFARRSGQPMLIYSENPSKFHQSKFYKNIMEPMVGGMRSGHSFGGGRKK